MTKMPFSNDLEMWHAFAKFGEWIKFVAKSQEQRLYSLCIHYSFDEAFEEGCSCEQIKRTKDFVAEEECWSCKFLELLKESEKK